MSEAFVPESIKVQREKLRPAKCCIGDKELQPTDPAMLLKCGQVKCLASLEFFRDAKPASSGFEVGCKVHGKMARIGIFAVQFNSGDQISLRPLHGD